MSSMEIMSLIMGLWYSLFALLKISDLKGFREIFVVYDPFAKRSRLYATAYPWIELTLGIGWFIALYFAAIMWPLMILGIIFWILTLVGISVGIRNNCTLCACMGSRVRLKLGFLSILEQVVMLAMIAFMSVDMLTMDHMSMMMKGETMEMMEMPNSQNASADAQMSEHCAMMPEMAGCEKFK